MRQIAALAAVQFAMLSGFRSTRWAADGKGSFEFLVEHFSEHFCIMEDCMKAILLSIDQIPRFLAPDNVYSLYILRR